MELLKIWLGAVRPRTLLLAVAVVLTGSAVAWLHGCFRYLVFFGALLCALLLQVLSNLANDLGDYTKGADGDQRVGPLRAMQTGKISRSAMVRAIVVVAVAALVSGAVLLYGALGLEQIRELALFGAIGMLAVIAALKYTLGKRPYGYIGLGDLAVFVFFGPAAVLGTFYLHTQMFDSVVLLPSIAMGLFCTGVLNVNNLRDFESDLASGKRTLVVIMGRDNARRYQLLLAVVGGICMLLFGWLQDMGMMYWWLVGPVCMLFVVVAGSVWRDGADFNAVLRRQAVLTFALALAFVLVVVISHPTKVSPCDSGLDCGIQYQPKKISGSYTQEQFEVEWTSDSTNVSCYNAMGDKGGSILISSAEASWGAPETAIADREKAARILVPIGTTYGVACQVLGEPDEFVRYHGILVQLASSNQYRAESGDFDEWAAAYYFSNGCIELEFERSEMFGGGGLLCKAVKKRGDVYKSSTPLSSELVKTNWDIIFYKNGTYTNLISGESGLSITNHLWRSGGKSEY